MSSSSPITRMKVLTFVRWSSITGRAKDVLRRELMDLVLEKSTNAQAPRHMNHGAEDVSKHASVTEVPACSSIDTAKGRQPFLVPELTVIIEYLTDQELEA